MKTQAIVTASPETMERIALLEGVKIEPGLMEEERVWVQEDELPTVLEALRNLGYRQLSPDQLDQKEQRTVLRIAAGSRRWNSDGELYGHRAREILAEHPGLRAKLEG